MHVSQSSYTVRLLLIQADKNDDDEADSSSHNKDGWLLLVIGAVLGAASVLTLTIIIAFTVGAYHRKPSLARKRVSSSQSSARLYSRYFTIYRESRIF